MPSLFHPFDLGSIYLKNRIVMAPMERSGARDSDGQPDADAARYFSQRAAAGLIVTGGIAVGESARPHAFEPGLYTPADIAAWRLVTGQVHEHGGVIFAQIRHGDRASHVSHQPNGPAPVSSTDTGATNATSMGIKADGQPAIPPRIKLRALRTDEVSRIVGEFAEAARNAWKAGFDGVEIQAANGYLHDQFLNGTLNTRGDCYGGSIEDRLRFTLETVDAVTDTIGREHTGIRLSPFGRFNEMPAFEGETETYRTLATELSQRNIAYVHISKQIRRVVGVSNPDNFLRDFRIHFQRPVIVAGGYLKHNGQAAIDGDEADLIAMGRPFLANPDLVERLRNDWPLDEPDSAALYSAGAKGYIEYPVYDSAKPRAKLPWRRPRIRWEL